MGSILSLRAAGRATGPTAAGTSELDDLAQAYQAHHAFVWRVLANLGVPRPAIEDAVQDVFLVLHRRRDAFDDRGLMRGLLFGIARRVARSHRRSAQRHPAAPSRGPTPELVRSDDPDEALARRQAAAIVEAFLDDLDEDKRMVFVLADIEGLAMPQIAELLGIKLNTAYSRLRLARQHFHLAVSKHRDGGER